MKIILIQEPKSSITEIYSLSSRQKNVLYNVCWYIGGVVKETLAYNVSKAAALGIKHSKETSTHKSGKIVLVLQR